MPSETEATRPMPKGRLLLATAGTLAAGALIVVGAVMPAEYDVDLLGLGKLSGLSRLWAPDENVVDPNAGSVRRAQEYPTPWRSDVIEIPLHGVDTDKSELEYKVRLPRDGTLIYSWEVIGDVQPGEFTYDFHGHTVTRDRTEPMTVSTYKQATGLKAQGSLTAPFEGIHGWYFANSGKRPVVVRVKLAGFYELIPNGAPGNEFRIRANVPASEARPDTPYQAP